MNTTSLTEQERQQGIKKIEDEILYLSRLMKTHNNLVDELLEMKDKQETLQFQQKLAQIRSIFSQLGTALEV